MTVRDTAPGVRTIDIRGELTAASEPDLLGTFAEAASGDTQTIALNLSELEYMNSGGIGLLVTVLIRAQRADQNLLAYGLSDHYRQIFSLTRLDEAIQIFDDEAAALTG